MVTTFPGGGNLSPGSLPPRGLRSASTAPSSNGSVRGTTQMNPLPGSKPASPRSQRARPESPTVSTTFGKMAFCGSATRGRVPPLGDPSRCAGALPVGRPRPGRTPGR